MSRPLLHRGVSGGRIAESSSSDSWGSQMKYILEKEDVDRRLSPHRHSSSKPLHSNSSSLFSENHSSKYSSTENGFGSESPNFGASRNRQSLKPLLLKFSLVLIVTFALLGGSLWWAILISTSSRGNIFRGNRRLQEQLIRDIEDFGVLSRSMEKLNEVGFCPSKFENYVPCFNVSENVDRQCFYGLKHECLVLPPKNYRIPLRWPTGRDVIWVGNVKITAQEVLSSGSLTKR